MRKDEVRIVDHALLRYLDLQNIRQGNRNLKHKKKAFIDYCVCYQCSRPFQLEDEVRIVEMGGRPRRLRYFHNDCYESMWLDVPDEEDIRVSLVLNFTSEKQ